MKKIILTLTLLAALLLSCRGGDSGKSTLPQEMPEDFSIVWETWIDKSLKNILDTREGKLQKDLVFSGTAENDFTPTDEQLNEIYSAVYECGLDTIERTLTSSELARGDTLVGVTPCRYYRVSFTANGRSYEINADETFRSYPDENDVQRFGDFTGKMWEIFNNLDEYKALPEPEGAYA